MKIPNLSTSRIGLAINPEPALLQLNILTKAANKARFIRSEFMERMILCMSTYEEFMIILTTSLLIVAILNLHKKK